MTRVASIRTSFACALLLAFAVGGSGFARAAEADPVAEAKDLFRGALQAYDAHEYGQALLLFQRSYRISGKAEILFDIAETYTALGDCKQAVAALDQLQRSGVSTTLLDRAKARRKELEPCSPAPSPPVAVIEPPKAIVSSRPEPIAAPPSARPEPPNMLSQAASPPRARSAWRTASWTLMGAGAALAAAGVVFELEARGAQQSVQSATAWDQGATRQDERGRTLDTAGTALLIAGAAAVLTGAVAYVVARRAH